MSNEARLRFTVLGCGSSPGVPRINGEWGACDPSNPKNRRTRCSLLVECIGERGTTRVVIDTSPDFRFQMLEAKATNLDAVIYTHSHADHVHGIDDLRQYALLQKTRIPVYGDKLTLTHLQRVFSYCFVAENGSMYPPICEAREITAGSLVTINGEGGAITALPIRQVHGRIYTLGFRFGAFDMSGKPTGGGVAYSPDVSHIEPDQAAMLHDLDVWIIDALQYRPHISHLSLNQALEWVQKLSARHAYLTHMHIPLDYETVRNETPDHIEPAHDGLVFEYTIKSA